MIHRAQLVAGMRDALRALSEADLDDHSLRDTCNNLQCLNPAGACYLCFQEFQGPQYVFTHVAEQSKQGADLLTAEQITRRIGIDQLKNLLIGKLYVSSQLCAQAHAFSSTQGAMAADRSGSDRFDILPITQSASYAGFLILAYSAAGPSEHARQALQRLAPRLVQAIADRTNLLHEIDRNEDLMIHAIDAAVIMVDDGYLHYKMNSSALDYLRVISPEERFDDVGQWPAVSNNDMRQLSELIRGLESTADNVANGAFKDERGNLTVVRVVRTLHNEGPICQAQRQLERLPLYRFIVSLRIGYKEACHLPSTAVSIFKFTPAERRLLESLVSGQTLAQIARVNGISYNTVRNQLASVCEKTQVGRQVDLVRYFAPLSCDRNS